MNPARLRALLSPFVAALSETQLAQLSAYLDLLLRWNARINLTAVRAPDHIVTRHFGESLFAAQALLATQDSRLEAADVGSGAGFPGLPLKVYAPHLRLTLVESQQKKAAFLREVVRTLGLRDTQVLTTRAEELACAGGLRAALVTLRAVEKFASILPAAARLVAPGGRLALLIGAAQADAARAALPAWSWHQPVAIPQSESRILLVGTNQPGHESAS